VLAGQIVKAGMMAFPESSSEPKAMGELSRMEERNGSAPSEEQHQSQWPSAGAYYYRRWDWSIDTIDEANKVEKDSADCRRVAGVGTEGEAPWYPLWGIAELKEASSVLLVIPDTTVVDG
jgi:hypothetical protein